MPTPQSLAQFARVMRDEKNSMIEATGLCQSIYENCDSLHHNTEIDCIAFPVKTMSIYSSMRNGCNSVKSYDNFNSYILVYPDNSWWAYEATVDTMHIGWHRGQPDITIADITENWCLDDFHQSFALFLASFDEVPELMEAYERDLQVYIWERSVYLTRGSGGWIWNHDQDCPQVFPTYEIAKAYIKKNTDPDRLYTICNYC